MRACLRRVRAWWQWWCRDLTGPLADDENYETGLVSDQPLRDKHPQ